MKVILVNPFSLAEDIMNVFSHSPLSLAADSAEEPSSRTHVTSWDGLKSNSGAEVGGSAIMFNFWFILERCLVSTVCEGLADRTCSLQRRIPLDGLAISAACNDDHALGCSRE